MRLAEAICHSPVLQAITVMGEQEDLLVVMYEDAGVWQLLGFRDDNPSSDYLSTSTLRFESFEHLEAHLIPVMHGGGFDPESWQPVQPEDTFN